MYRIVVYGRAAPQGSKKAVGRDKKGRTILVEMGVGLRPWRDAVRDAALAVRAGAAPLDCPICARMVFTMQKPQSTKRNVRAWARRRPDLSKLIRSTEDALTDAGIWVDDAAVVEYSRLAKVFPGEDEEALEAPGVVITVRALGRQWALPLSSR